MLAGKSTEIPAGIFCIKLFTVKKVYKFMISKRYGVNMYRCYGARMRE